MPKSRKHTSRRDCPSCSRCLSTASIEARSSSEEKPKPKKPSKLREIKENPVKRSRERKPAIREVEMSPRILKREIMNSTMRMQTGIGRELEQLVSSSLFLDSHVPNFFRIKNELGQMKEEIQRNRIKVNKEFLEFKVFWSFFFICKCQNRQY